MSEREHSWSGDQSVDLDLGESGKESGWQVAGLADRPRRRWPALVAALVVVGVVGAAGSLVLTRQEQAGPDGASADPFDPAALGPASDPELGAVDATAVPESPSPEPSPTPSPLDTTRAVDPRALDELAATIRSIAWPEAAQDLRLLVRSNATLLTLDTASGGATATTVGQLGSRSGFFGARSMELVGGDVIWVEDRQVVAAPLSSLTTRRVLGPGNGLSVGRLDATTVVWLVLEDFRVPSPTVSLTAVTPTGDVVVAPTSVPAGFWALGAADDGYVVVAPSGTGYILNADGFSPTGLPVAQAGGIAAVSGTGIVCEDDLECSVEARPPGDEPWPLGDWMDTTTGEFLANWQLSPRGDRAARITLVDSLPALVVADRDGRRVQVTLPASVQEFRWSPDGRWIAAVGFDTVAVIDGLQPEMIEIPMPSGLTNARLDALVVDGDTQARGDG